MPSNPPSVGEAGGGGKGWILVHCSSILEHNYAAIAAEESKVTEATERESDKHPSNYL